MDTRAIDQAALTPQAGPGQERKSEATEPTDEQVDHLITHIKDWSITHGLQLKLIRLETETTVPSRGINVTVLPTPYPKRCFDEAQRLQPLYNELYMRAASQPDWLHSVIEPLLEYDELAKALWEIWTQVRDAGGGSNVVAALFRSDYMLHQPAASVAVSIKQVEMNTFSCSGACHAERVARLHGHLRRAGGLQKEGESSSPLPVNSPTRGIIGLLYDAHRLYEAKAFELRKVDRPFCVLMVVQPLNFNIADERPIEYGLWDVDVPCFRMEWLEVLSRTNLDEDRRLFYDHFGSEYEVSVIYYRAGYDAAEYSTQAGRDTRLELEMSRAFKCPDVLTHLTGFKVVQAALCAPGFVERFLPTRSNAEVQAVFDTFMTMQALDSTVAGVEARKLATDPETAKDFVLKPNLEGGGHNIYGAAIPDFLASIPEEQWGTYQFGRICE